MDSVWQGIRSEMLGIFVLDWLRISRADIRRSDIKTWARSASMHWVDMKALLWLLASSAGWKAKWYTPGVLNTL
jgi:hypothetical protein